ncbi:hypothetical protein [Paraburkholderia adhaesiva]|uniref:hypothetical protein n=1 Tax=Paraburkholderia adhaesiva TaxID=2883244 RepID=UPI001F3146A9|nr:hypothetical protein [Paraburkholderia adhaesiva]
MRFITTGILLCVVAAPVIAGERYVEIWNPPEARTPGVHSPQAGKKARPHHDTKRKVASADHPTPRMVAQPALRANPPTVPATPGNAAPGHNRSPLITPQIGPDGNVLQVGYRTSTSD